LFVFDVSDKVKDISQQVWMLDESNTRCLSP